MLIDRNDELAALHEKGHLQEAQIAAGTMELSLREDEVRASGCLDGYAEHFIWCQLEQSCCCLGHTSKQTCVPPTSPRLTAACACVMAAASWLAADASAGAAGL